MERQTRPRGLIGGVLPAGPFPSDRRKVANPCGAKRQRYRDEMEKSRIVLLSEARQVT